jgi:hypothetical protein
MAVEPRGSTLLGISLRPPQLDAFGLDGPACLEELLTHPFQLIRLGAYWNRIEPEPGAFQPDELDWQVDAAEAAGKQIIICVGALKTFGYPEFFVPEHHLAKPLMEGALVEPAAHEELLGAAIAFSTRVVERYRERKMIVAWQVEHEAVDPLGVEHSWRLSAGFVGREVDAVRAADPTRPIMMSGFLPTSLPVRLQQWWRTRDQGDSLAVARRQADIVGIDFYPRHALFGLLGGALYLDGSRRPWQSQMQRAAFVSARAAQRVLMVSEGQAEPWEVTTIPPNPGGRAMFSCTPERVIANYNQIMGVAREAEVSLHAYLFWGAEYWMLRKKSGDSTYVDAFARVVEEA